MAGPAWTLLAVAGIVSPTAAQVTPGPREPGSGLVPIVDPPGPALEFEFPGLAIGVAEYAEGPTGVTVFYFDEPVRAAVDVQGGGPGTILTDLLRYGYETRFVRAVSFAGGSAYGLAAAGGVAAAIKERLPDPGAWEQIPVVPGAIIFDLGGRRFTSVTPDFDLGAAALRAARPGRFPLGARGAGRFAMQGGYFGARQYSGQGGALGTLGPIRVAVFTVVNALGTVVDRRGDVVRCRAPGPDGCGPIREWLARAGAGPGGAVGGAPAGEAAVPSPTGRPGLTANTTITLVVTNADLPFWALQRLATQVHASLARAIQPFSTVNDGDVLFVVTTGTVEDPAVDITRLASLAAETAWDAVLASVPARDPAPVAGPPASPGRMASFAGDYGFAPGVRASVRLVGGRLEVLGPERDNLYLPPGSPVRLIPVSETVFLLDTPRRDRLRFEVSEGGAVTGLTINPGHWPIPAWRLP